MIGEYFSSTCCWQETYFKIAVPGSLLLFLLAIAVMGCLMVYPGTDTYRWLFYAIWTTIFYVAALVIISAFVFVSYLVFCLEPP